MFYCPYTHFRSQQINMSIPIDIWSIFFIQMYGCSTVLHCIMCKMFYHINCISSLDKQNVQNYCKHWYYIKCISVFFHITILTTTVNINTDVIAETWTCIIIAFSFQELENKAFILSEITIESGKHCIQQWSCHKLL